MTKPNPSHAQPGTRLPTGFRSTCRMTRWVPIEELLAENPHKTTSRWDRKLGCEVYRVQCDLVMEDAANYEAHMSSQHGRSMGSYRRRARRPGTFADQVPMRMWTPPKPKLLVPAEWADRDDVTLTVFDELDQDAVT